MTIAGFHSQHLISRVSRPTGAATPAPSAPTTASTLQLTAVATLGPVMLASAYLLITLLPPAPLWQAVTRVLPAGAVLLALHPALPHGIWWWRSLVLGTLNFGSFFALQAYSLSVMPGGISATIAAMQTVVVPMAATLLLGERLRPIQLVAAPIGVFGVALLVLRGSASLHGPGVAAAALMALCVAGGMLLTRLWHAPAGVHHVTATAWQMMAGGLILLPAAVLIEGPMPPSMTATEWVITGWLAFGATAVPFVAVFGAMHHGLPATVVSRVMLLCPLLVSVGDWLIYRHSLTLVQAVGAALVLMSVVAVCSRFPGRMIVGSAPRIPVPRSPHAH
jgi:probable blue pigment (indigoidine) exporter